MRIVLQRVSEASVSINNQTISKVGSGILLLLGIEEIDKLEDVEWLVKKVVNLRIFDDENGVMNRSLLETGGEILVVSQFTLHASTKKGNRPSYIKAARPETAIPLYQKFIEILQTQLSTKVQTGEFGAMMQVQLTNDGPVTIIIDSKNRD
ncbi:MAG: D-tyrosyl-tRNA(Tyr) deacylase [Bacteroidetes bacterium HGW-Bacteroidetes-4]|jgi:D-tyrosyl-tRNA(Tyr) deacylase|nr:MAG: D-tyrosyl-tRNA(Tyr) deacylase [Bacteroidetes bacterium HGW-Bacteroidetes-4]